MSITRETTYLSSGSLNALVIFESRSPQDLSVLVGSLIENQGSMPGPAEQAMHDVQGTVVKAVATRAVEAGKDACELSDASLDVAVRRSGDAFQDVAVMFQCSMPESECCRRGLKTAVEALTEGAKQAKSTVLDEPLAAFQYFGG